jgi:hypothetical protein
LPFKESYEHFTTFLNQFNAGGAKAQRRKGRKYKNRNCFSKVDLKTLRLCVKINLFLQIKIEADF